MKKIARFCLLVLVAGCGGGGATGPGSGAGGTTGSGSGGVAVPGSGGAHAGSGGTSMTGGGGSPGSGGASGASAGGAGAAGSGGAAGLTGTGGVPGSGGRGAGGTGGGAAGRGGDTAVGGSSARGGHGGGATGGAGAVSGAGGVAGTGGRGGAGGSATTTGSSTVIAGCSILPANHIFNTAIDSFPVDAHSTDYLTTIGDHNLHLDLGTSTDQQSDTYYGIPYNVIQGQTENWVNVAYRSGDPELDWDPRAESDCLDSSRGFSRTVVSPCTATAAPAPVLPIPTDVLVEGGYNANANNLPYGDHHILVLDANDCRLYETFHSYGVSGSATWDIFGSAIFDLRSSVLRPDGWTSADAAGFPILPLLLRVADINGGAIRHALRFTITSSKIRNSHVWPARHHTSNGTTSANLPPMGQLFRLKAAYAIPGNFTGQARAILQAMKTYGMYIADGGSDMYVTGEPNAAWTSDTISQVQSVGASQFEAVDLTPIRQRAGFDPDSAAVPAP